jgi:crotonobetaine/carnitine-CoA ligase
VSDTIVDWLLAGAREDAARPLVHFEGKTFSRMEVAAASLRVAGWFRREGFAAGDRVALMLGNQPEFLLAWFGGGLAGMVTAALAPELRGEELAARLLELRPRAVIASAQALPSLLSLRDRVPSLDTVILTDAAPAGTTHWSALLAGPATPAALPSSGAPMGIVYTGGATDQPRAVTWRHGGPLASAAGFAQLLGIDSRDRLMIVLPLYVANAQFSVAMALASGASILLERGFDAQRFWSAARKGGATQVSLSGLLLSQLYAERPRRTDADHGIRIALSVATPKDLHEALELRFGLCVVEAFGLTETGFVAVNPVERGRRKLGSIGLPVPWAEVAVLDEQLHRLPPGAIGEICVRPRGQPAAWLHSGDLATSDEEGFLTFVDRRDDALRRRGGTFSTRPIEHALLRHPAVAEAAVLALPESGADEALAVVVLRAPVRFEELSRFCVELLNGQPAPLYFKAVEQVPKTPSGRIRKAELRRQPGILEHLHRVVR